MIDIRDTSDWDHNAGKTILKNLKKKSPIVIYESFESIADLLATIEDEITAKAETFHQIELIKKHINGLIKNENND